MLIPVIRRSAILVSFTLLIATSVSIGQVVAYDPEIGTVQAGVILDAQAVVSYDRKYVTINFQAQESRPIALIEFPVVFQTSSGFVGGAMPTGQPPAGGPVAMTSPAEIQLRATALKSVLSKPGMHLLATTR